LTIHKIQYELIKREYFLDKKVEATGYIIHRLSPKEKIETLRAIKVYTTEELIEEKALNGNLDFKLKIDFLEAYIKWIEDQIISIKENENESLVKDQLESSLYWIPYPANKIESLFANLEKEKFIENIPDVSRLFDKEIPDKNDRVIWKGKQTELMYFLTSIYIKHIYKGIPIYIIATNLFKDQNSK
jgi:hypothetical protein